MTNDPSSATVSPGTPGAAAMQLTIEQALQLATEHQAAGRLPLAEGLLRQILQVRPKNAFALHLMGIIAHQAGDTNRGLELIKQAIESQPRVAQFHANLGEMYRLLKRLDLAVKHGEEAVVLDPLSATAHSNLGIAYYDSKELDKAEASQRRALRINPQMAPALNNLGSILRQRKDKAGAIAMYREVLKLAPQHLESINNLGAVLSEMDRPEEAVAILLAAIKIQPNYPEAHCNIATAFLQLEQFDKAEVGFSRAIALRPDYAEAYQGMAKLMQERNNLPEAEAMALRALTLTPDKAEPHSLLGAIYSETGFPDKAEQAFEKALEIEPELISAQLGKGHLLMETGKLSGAEALFCKSLELDPDNLGARLALAQVRKTKKNDDNMKALIAVAEDIANLPETKALPMHFALGKCYDDTKQYDLAFKHFAEGCRLKRKRVHYSAEDSDLLVQNIRSIFTREMIDNNRGGGATSNLPIFVLGMPRSGTTLTEQIIASHPLVHGAGELPDLMQIASQPGKQLSQGYPLSIRGLTQAEFRIMGERYVEGLQVRNPTAQRITDKMPANFKLIGLIHLMLPNAKIIHVRRDPVDTCISGFMRLFHHSQFQSYDLVELGRYYRNYAELMNHWRDVLPAGSFYEIQYEDLISDPELHARALLQFCNLEWDDACLDFHKTERSIRTASVTQVRQPIYNTSVERWRHYEKHLGPLLSILGDLVPVVSQN